MSIVVIGRGTRTSIEKAREWMAVTIDDNMIINTLNMLLQFIFLYIQTTHLKILKYTKRRLNFKLKTYLIYVMKMNSFETTLFRNI